MSGEQASGVGDPVGEETVMTIAEFVAWRYPNVALTPEQLQELDARVAAVARPMRMDGAVNDR